jgi:hypothetical protein
MRLAFLGLAVAVAIGRLHAANYYVDYVGGSDSNFGTSQKVPWQHCPGDPAATGRAATTSLAPGDTVFFKGGVDYVLAGDSGIALIWNGAPGAVITYDGNSSGYWGNGRARFTDAYGSRSITAFHAAGFAHDLAFRSLEFAGIGGSAFLPWDPSTAIGPRYGGGIGFPGGCDGVTIHGCVFREIGYWFNQRPMSAAAIRGTGVSSRGASRLRFTNCEFSRVATGIEFLEGGTLSNVEIEYCTFREAMVWPIGLPPETSGTPTGVAVRDSTFLEDNFFSDVAWTGYGHSPRTELVEVPAGASFTFAASAIASGATFQWQKNGIVIPGANDALLAFGAVSIADSGIYTVLATNEGGSKLSNSAIVMVGVGASQNVPPVITTEPADLQVPYLGSATFSVVATGTPAPTYQWMKDGAPLAGATNSVLSLFSLTVGGNYSVVVSNVAGSVVSRTATLTLFGLPQVETTVPPQFTIHPTDLVATLYSTVTFVASAFGTPAPTYQWQKDGSPIPGRRTPGSP